MRWLGVSMHGTSLGQRVQEHNHVLAALAASGKVGAYIPQTEEKAKI
jgi:hypothetical protein